MAERERAIELANRVLENPSRDPDEDISVLARQFLRAVELVECVVVLDDRHGHGIKFGGRFHGWLMHKHPEGQWVSVRQLVCVDPFADDPWAKMLQSNVVPIRPAQK